jgi:hypothetical protein
MATIKIPKKTQDRLVAGLKKYQPIVGKLRERDISEADTVTVIKDMLTDIFGYDKYTELTSEQQIRGTFCDLAIKVEGKIYYLAEVKSAGTNLNDNHLRQAINYGAHQGIEWKVYRIKFSQPIDYEEVFNFDVTKLSPRSGEDLSKLYMLCRESISSDSLADYHRHAQIVNRYIVAELLQSDAMIGTLRRELRKLFDGVRATDEDLRIILTTDVMKRDTIDGDPPKAAKAVVKKAVGAIARKAAKSIN